MNTKKLLALIAVGFAFTAAHAAVDSYLYWMVDNATQNGTPVNFDYARVTANGSYLNIYNVDTGLSYDSPYAASDLYAGGSVGNSTYGAPSMGVYSGFDSSVGYNTFLIELLSGEAVVGSMSYSLASLTDYIYNSTTGGGGVNALVVSAIPEPTSGLLSLFGLAALALRRRRRA